MWVWVRARARVRGEGEGEGGGGLGRAVMMLVMRERGRAAMLHACMYLLVIRESGRRGRRLLRRLLRRLPPRASAMSGMSRGRGGRLVSSRARGSRDVDRQDR